jgi:hypothetical protein
MAQPGRADSTSRQRDIAAAGQRGACCKYTPVRWRQLSCYTSCMRTAKTTWMALAAALLALASSCGGPGGPGAPLIDPNSGRIAGTIDIQGPFDPAPLGVALFFPGTAQQVESQMIGKVPSTITAFFQSGDIQYSFSNLFVGSYEIVVFADDGVNPRRDLFRSASVTTKYNGESQAFDTSFSFTGASPLGSAAGTVAVTGTWPAGRSVFIGVAPTNQPGVVLHWPVAQADLVGGNLAFTVPGLAVGSYRLGLYSADAAGVVTNHGTAAANTTITAGAIDVTGADFNAAF